MKSACRTQGQDCSWMAGNPEIENRTGNLNCNSKMNLGYPSSCAFRKGACDGLILCARKKLVNGTERCFASCKSEIVQVSPTHKFHVQGRQEKCRPPCAPCRNLDRGWQAEGMDIRITEAQARVLGSLIEKDTSSELARQKSRGRAREEHDAR
jgi:hypothetical protein